MNLTTGLRKESNLQKRDQTAFFKKTSGTFCLTLENFFLAYIEFGGDSICSTSTFFCRIFANYIYWGNQIHKQDTYAYPL